VREPLAGSPEILATISVTSGRGLLGARFKTPGGVST